MTDNRFGPSGPDARAGRTGSGYDYFAGPVATGPSTFGGPTAPTVAPAAVNPFGGPAGGPAPFSAGPAAGNSFGAPAGPVSPFGAPSPPVTGGAPSRRVVLVVGLVVGVLVLTAGGWFGYRVYERNRPVVMPATLGGLPVSANSAVRQSVTSAQAQLQRENPTVKLQVQAYAADSTRILIAAALRGTTTATTDLASFGTNIGGTQQVGNSVCATAPTSHVTVCERSSGDLTVIAASVTRAPAVSAVSVAALVDEIWAEV